MNPPIRGPATLLSERSLKGRCEHQKEIVLGAMGIYVAKKLDARLRRRLAHP